MSTHHSPLRQALADYLALRRALGFELATAGRLLGQFVAYLDARGTGTVTAEAALAWARLPAHASTTWHAIRLSAVRGFAAWLHSTDPAVEVPPPGLLRHGPDRATPYLYSDAEVGALLEAAGTLRPRLRAATYQTLLGLLATSGVRIGEAIAADVGDLDTGRGLLAVHHAKFGKHRLVPLHPSTLGALAGYADLREAAHPQPASPALFISTAGTRLHQSNVNVTFTRLTEQAGLTPRPGSCRPRIHDLRHSFAVATLLGWYATGADVEALMPHLSTYLGHTDPKNTFWYLSAAPELMALAGQRLDAHLAGAP